MIAEANASSAMRGWARREMKIAAVASSDQQPVSPSDGEMNVTSNFEPRVDRLEGRKGLVSLVFGHEYHRLSFGSSANAFELRNKRL